MERAESRPRWRSVSTRRSAAARTPGSHCRPPTIWPRPKRWPRTSLSSATSRVSVRESRSWFRRLRRSYSRSRQRCGHAPGGPGGQVATVVARNLCFYVMSSNLVDVLTLRSIQKLADTGTLARGTAYFHDGAVGLLDEDKCEVRASVQGTQRYRVRLAAGSDGELEYECDCPVGDDGTFCKHAVAVALSWLENAGEEVFQADETASAKPRKKRKTHGEEIREYLETLDESTLREWLIEAADRDRGIRDKILFAAKAKAGTDASSLKSVVRQAT